MRDSQKFITYQMVTAHPSGVVRRLRPSTGHEILIPPVKRSGDLPLAMAALLPNQDHNSLMLGFLQRRPAFSSARTTAVGLFAADPFLPRPLMAKALRSAGVSSVFNFPVAHSLGADFSDALGEVGLGFGRDLDLLTWFADDGFQVGCFADGFERAAEAVAAGIAIIVLGAAGDDQPFDTKLTELRRLSAELRRLRASGPALTLLHYLENPEKAWIEQLSGALDGVVTAYWDN